MLLPANQPIAMIGSHVMFTNCMHSFCVQPVRSYGRHRTASLLCTGDTRRFGITGELAPLDYAPIMPRQAYQEGCMHRSSAAFVATCSTDGSPELPQCVVLVNQRGLPQCVVVVSQRVVTLRNPAVIIQYEETGHQIEGRQGQ